MSWPMVELASVGYYQAGNGFPTKYQGKKQGAFPFAKVGDVSTCARAGKLYLVEANNYVDLDDVQAIKGKIVPPNAILFAKIGEAIRLNNRALSGCELLIDNNTMAFVASEDKLDFKYAYYFFRQLDLYNYAGKTTVPALRKADLDKINIPLPPLDEQKRIAAILDKADAIRQKRKQAIALADEFLRSVFLDMFGDPVTNPKGWEKRELGQLLSSIDSGKSPKCESREAAEREWGVLKLSAVTYGEYRSCENKAFLGEPALIEKYEVKNGDLLFTRKNTHKLVAAVSYVFETEKKRALPDLIFRLNVRDEESLNKLYLFSLLAYPSQRKEIQALAGGAAGSMPNISKANLSSVQIPIPPIALQRKFAEVVNAYRKVFAKFAMHSEIEGLFKSLSQKAFSGQL